MRQRNKRISEADEHNQLRNRLLRTLRSSSWLKAGITCSSLSLFMAYGLPSKLTYGQVVLGENSSAPAVAPDDPTPAPPSTTLGTPGDGNSWDMEEEFEEVDGVTPLLRGPLHEAYAERFTDDDEEPVIIDKAPPELIDEQPPEVAPEGENFVWIPGYWGWDIAEENFVWVSGVWRKVPPKHQWIPGYWTEIDGGWQWVSGFWTTTAEENIVYLPAPPESLDVGPSSPAPGDNYFWIPGCWNFTSGSYTWRAGYWGTAQNDWVWMPHRYVWTPSGYIYRRGYWDYRLPNRGIVFTPVQFRPGYHGIYRPSYTIQVNPLLLANMFIAPGFSQYYYGNYFGYSGRRNVYSWSSYYRHGYDPFLSYYSHQRRHSKWLHDLHRLERHIAVTPHLQSRIRVADQFRHRHDLYRSPNNIDTLLRVTNARRLAESRHPSFRPPVALRVEKDINSRFPADRVVNPMRDFERKRRDLEKAVTDIDRERSRRPSRDGQGSRPNSGAVAGVSRDTIELKELKLGGRDEFKGRPPIPRDLQVDRIKERVEGRPERPNLPTVDRSKARENRAKELDRLIGGRDTNAGRDAEKLSPEQLRDLRRDLLESGSNRRPSGRDRDSRESSRPDRPNVDRPNVDRPNSERPNATRPNVGRPSPSTPDATTPPGERSSLTRPLPDRSGQERPNSERPQLGRPDSGRPNVNRPGTVRPEQILRDTLPPQSNRLERPRVQRDAPTRTNPPTSGGSANPSPSTRPSTPRPSTPRPSTPRPSAPRPSAPRPSAPAIERPRIERPQIERPSSPRSERAPRPSQGPSETRVNRPAIPLDTGLSERARPNPPALSRPAPSRPSFSPPSSTRESLRSRSEGFSAPRSNFRSSERSAGPSRGPASRPERSSPGERGDRGGRDRGR